MASSDPAHRQPQPGASALGGPTAGPPVGVAGRAESAAFWWVLTDAPKAPARLWWVVLLAVILHLAACGAAAIFAIQRSVARSESPPPEVTWEVETPPEPPEPPPPPVYVEANPEANQTPPPPTNQESSRDQSAAQREPEPTSDDAAPTVDGEDDGSLKIVEGGLPDPEAPAAALGPSEAVAAVQAATGAESEADSEADRQSEASGDSAAEGDSLGEGDGPAEIDAGGAADSETTRPSDAETATAPAPDARTAPPTAEATRDSGQAAEAAPASPAQASGQLGVPDGDATVLTPPPGQPDGGGGAVLVAPELPEEASGEPRIGLLLGQPDLPPAPLGLPTDETRVPQGDGGAPPVDQPADQPEDSATPPSATAGASSASSASAQPRPRPQVPQALRSTPPLGERGRLTTAAPLLGEIAISSRLTDFGVYRSRLLEVIYQQWIANIQQSGAISAERGTDVVIRFAINDLGELIEHETLQSTAGTTGQLIALEAVISRAPFGPWSPDMREALGEEVEVLIRFSYR